MKYELATYSRTGGRRSNQDRVTYSEKNNSILIALADGLGGHAGGEIAAEIATEYAIHAYQSIRHPIITQPSSFLALSVIEANKQIFTKTKDQFPDKQPRTTLVLCLIQDGYAYWAHVGDSRLYHFRDGGVLTRTIDHSPVEKLHQQGLISEEDMQHHPKKSYLSNCIGGKHKPSVTLSEETRLEPGDNIMLCSDGIWEAVTNDKMYPFLEYEDLDEGVEELLIEAENIKQLSCDNITVASLRWQDEVTKAPPLQADEVKTVNQKTLWEDAKQQIKKGKKLAPTKPAQDNSENYQQKVIDDAEQTIQDMEDFLKDRSEKN